MSGIIGIYYADGRPVDRADLDRMVASIAHRGPDGAGIWQEGSVGLGHCMLHTTPESLHERLPLVDPTGTLAITADARIDNRDELISLLGLTRGPADEISDSELILASYEQWGEQCPERLLGDFAFAVWDARRQTLFCARDHFGVRPFYYYHSPGRAFVFGSEIKALLRLAEVLPRVNEDRVASYMLRIFDDSASTFYQEIFRLLPGYSLTVTRGAARLHCYYALDPTRELRLGSDAEYAEGFRHLFTEAVRCRLRGVGPMVSLLSGGLDSSSVTCVARDLLTQAGASPLLTISSTFDRVADCDERSFINAVLKGGGLEPHYVPSEQIGPFTDLERVLWHEEEPLHSLNLYLTWGWLGAARELGSRVTLDGHDGDGVVSHGFGYLNELGRAGRLFDLAREVLSLARIYDTSTWEPLRKYGRRYALAPLLARYPVLRLAGRIKRTLHRTRGRRDDESVDHLRWARYLNPELVRRRDLIERYRAWQQLKPGPVENEREAHYRTVTHSIETFVLEDLQRAGGAFSIERRHPFFDKRLVEYCLALPGEQKLRRGLGRLVMRRAMQGILPVEVQWRPGKTDFTPSLCYAMFTLQREQFSAFLSGPPGFEAEYVDVGVLSEAYRRLGSRELWAPLNEMMVEFWRAMWLALWLRSSCPGAEAAGKEVVAAGQPRGD